MRSGMSSATAALLVVLSGAAVGVADERLSVGGGFVLLNAEIMRNARGADADHQPYKDLGGNEELENCSDYNDEEFAVGTLRCGDENAGNDGYVNDDASCIMCSDGAYGTPRVQVVENGSDPGYRDNGTTTCGGDKLLGICSGGNCVDPEHVAGSPQCEGSYNPQETQD